MTVQQQRLYKYSLVWACTHGSLRDAQEAIERGDWRMEDNCNDVGGSALHMTCASAAATSLRTPDETCRLVRLLVQQCGFDVNSCASPLGKTPLRMSLANDAPPLLLRTLVDLGAHVDAHDVIRVRNHEAAKVLIEDGKANLYLWNFASFHHRHSDRWWANVAGLDSFELLVHDGIDCAPRTAYEWMRIVGASDARAAEAARLNVLTRRDLARRLSLVSGVASHEVAVASAITTSMQDTLRIFGLLTSSRDFAQVRLVCKTWRHLADETLSERDTEFFVWQRRA
jgi:hypothetical protein